MTSSGHSQNGERSPAGFSVTHPTHAICVIEVACDLDIATVPRLRELMAQEFNNSHEGLLLDLSECEFMGSTGLAALVTAREQSLITRTRFALVGTTHIITRALETTGLLSMFDTYPSLDEALTSLNNAKPTETR